jgi:hypothetical protein
MSKPVSSILIMPPEGVAARIVPEQLVTYLESTFPRFAFAVDTMWPMPGDYYCFVVLPNAEGGYEVPSDQENKEILAKLRAYGDGRNKLN